MHYHFADKSEMEAMIARGEFIEYAHVHTNIYGTSIAAVEAVSNAGKACLLDIDVQVEDTADRLAGEEGGLREGDARHARYAHRTAHATQLNIPASRATHVARCSSYTCHTQATHRLHALHTLHTRRSAPRHRHTLQPAPATTPAAAPTSGRRDCETFEPQRALPLHRAAVLRRARAQTARPRHRV